MAWASGLHRKGVVPFLGITGVGALLLSGAAPASATGGSATGPEGQKLTVSKSSGLATDGETVTVTGSGYNTAKGIYVAFCVDNGAGKTPTPCVGGVDMSGESGASAWISANPPSYGKGLAKPYEGSGHKGSFSVRLKVRAKDTNTDCTKSGVKCAVITRNDHTRGGDQSQTVRVPVSFGGGDSGAGAGDDSEATPTATTGASATNGGGAADTGEQASDGPLASTGSVALTAGATAVVLVAAGTGTWLWARRRRAAAAG
ncbi:hypothetical protein [Streptomyces caeruleatus]|uniref:LPXTG cell wall anchor domain-containing protein n=1 Tax=Streptomyces caeruleatus TaxID=661399 RepID=A0A101U8N0_9ACTN|nr:hypothetical protein [Streptomyces caeruleatus]KUO05971.1 hypothetical protein AQJ67_03935 [Streptomyces caeruleatus]